MLNEKVRAELLKRGWLFVEEDSSALMVNGPLFLRGIIAFLNPYNKYREELDSASGFVASKKRTLRFGDKSPSFTEMLKSLEINKVDPSQKLTSRAKEFQKVRNLFGRIFQLPVSDNTLYNPERRDEYYIPVVIQDRPDPSNVSSLYIHPWEIGAKKSVSQGADDLDQGQYDTYCTATCIGGTQIRCTSDNDNQRPFMKHDHQFYSKEKIDDVSLVGMFDDNLYEDMQFQEARRVAAIMAKSSVKDKGNGRPTAQVYHHLPWKDYILFGVSLFIQGRITLEALDQLCRIVILKKDRHIEKLGQIYTEAGLNCAFITPFDNLVDDKIADPELIDAPDTKDTDVALTVLKQLGIDNKKYEILADDSDQKRESDKQFVQTCLQRLAENSFNEQQKQTWTQFFGTPERIDVNTIEKLLHAANSIVAISAVSQSRNPCSFISVHEKQIQVMMDKLSRQMAIKKSITCLTYLPIFFAMSFSNSRTGPGLPFYFECGEFASEIRELLDKNITERAMQNIAAYQQHDDKKSQPIDDYLMGIDSSVDSVDSADTEDVMSVASSPGSADIEAVMSVASSGYSSPKLGSSRFILLPSRPRLPATDLPRDQGSKPRVSSPLGKMAPTSASS